MNEVTASTEPVAARPEPDDSNEAWARQWVAHIRSADESAIEAVVKRVAKWKLDSDNDSLGAACLAEIGSLLDTLPCSCKGRTPGSTPAMFWPELIHCILHHAATIGIDAYNAERKALMESSTIPGDPQ